VNAGAVLVLRAHRWRSTPLRLQPWQLAIGLVPLAILAAVLEDPATIDLTPTLLLAVLYSGPLATAFAFWAYQTIARTLTPSQTTTGLLAVPVVGLASSALFLGEPLGPGDLAGFATTLAGIALVAGPGRVREP
jgi:drug/metabolite transporter (DMT)-like permease